MIVQHNMSAANANRQLGINATNLSKSTEKLSSGYRINRAGDDAAGLTISEKMRGQIRGLDQASSNAQDGISLIQTAEGALDETTNILQRMRELSVQGANDTNTAEDRAAIDEEMKALTSEIDRIAKNTEFNTQNLLDGSFKGSFQIGANANQTINLSIGQMDSAFLGLTSGTKISLNEDAKGLKDGQYSIAENGTDVLDAKGNVIGAYSATSATGSKPGITLADGKVINLGHAATSGSIINVSGGKVNSLTMGSTKVYDTVATTTAVAKNSTTVDKAGTYTIKDGKYFNKDGVPTELEDLEFKTGYGNEGDKFTISDTGAVTGYEKLSTNGADGKLAAGDYKVSGNNLLLGDKLVGTLVTDGGTPPVNKTELTLADGSGTVDLRTLGLVDADVANNKTFSINGVDVTNSSKASGSTTTIDNAIKAVSKQRSQLGAVQNRLEHTISNLDNSSENLQSAESRIRDVDMAEEMVSYSKSNILQQAAQSMLAQAKNSTQGVLSLLQ